MREKEQQNRVFFTQHFIKYIISLNASLVCNYYANKLKV